MPIDHLHRRRLFIAPHLACAAMALAGLSTAGACDLCAISAAAAEEDDHANGAAARLVTDAPLLEPGTVCRACSAGGDRAPQRIGAGGDAEDAAQGDPAPLARPAAPRRSRLGLSVGAIMQLTDATHPHTGTHEVDDPAGQYLRTTTGELVLGARFGERYGARVYLPYLDRSYRRAIPGGIEQGEIYGPGDALVEGTALALRRVGARSAAFVTVIAGVKLPTGSAERLDDEGDPSQGQTTVGGHVHGLVGPGTVALVHPHDLALGSGSYDGQVGASAFWKDGRLYATARAFYKLRGTGRDGYRCGDEVSWGGGPGLYLLQHGRSTVGLLANLTGEVRAPDRLDGQRVDDSGGSELFIGPDLSATWHGLSAEAGVDLPVFQRVDGEQLVIGYRMHLGLNWGF